MAKRSDKALRSFFGAREGGQNRRQDLNTPQFLIDAILDLWPNGIALDPCSNSNSIVPAKMRLYEYETISGLRIKWPDYTYANPPYQDVKAWLRKPRSGAEHLMLVPVRTNRRWWCQSASKATRICWLDPFPFIGFKSAFPASLAMLYYGSRYARFEEVFAEYGSIGIFKIYQEIDCQQVLALGE